MIKAFSKACEKNKDIHLSIYGTGEDSYIAKLKELIKEYDVQGKIELMGRTSNVSEVLKNADAFLMTSDYEGMPNALLEAMATGLVCISTDCRTGPKDMIDNGI
jgi:glycosyltransferase involved in cell wall biosynthesis